MQGILIIPTGLGCALGGDAAYLPGVKLISKCVDKLIVNPNAVNASDINEMPENSLYVEGSLINRLLQGRINIEPVKSYNRILMVVNPPCEPYSVNTANAGVWGLGADVSVLALRTPLIMTAHLNPNGTAGGTVEGWEELCDQVSALDFDALAIHTPIDCDPEVAKAYWRGEIHVNPWGAVEAIASKLIADRLNRPVAHAPSVVEEASFGVYAQMVVDKTKAPEIISNTYCFCILKGLHRAPRVDLDCRHSTISRKDIDFLISPYGCWGTPHEACQKNGIKVIIVNENKTCLKDFSYPMEVLTSPNVVFVDNYLEAAGVLMSWQAGVDHKTITL